MTKQPARGRARARGTAVALAAALTLPLIAAPVAAVADDDIELEVVWERQLDSSGIIGSAGVGVLDGEGISLIVGAGDGKAYALHADDGSTVAGWPYQAPAGITGTPSVIGSGSAARIFFGLGRIPDLTNGGYLALSASGQKLWYKQVTLLPGGRGGYRGVQGSLAVGKFPTGTGMGVVGGAMGQMQLAVDALTGKTLPGFPWLMADTNFSTPALAPIVAGSTNNYIIEGGDSTAGVSYFKTYKNGGHIRILSAKGNYGKPALNDGLHCEYVTNEVVQGSPAVGPFLADGKTGIVVGMGSFYANASDRRKLIAIDTSCKKKWSAALDADSFPSPALADLSGTGQLDVVSIDSLGNAYGLDGETGARLWKTSLGRLSLGHVTTFQAPGDDFQYVIAPTISGAYLLDGRDGSIVMSFSTDMSIKNAITVTRDPDGSIGLTVAGGRSGGFVRHYRVVGSNVASVATPGAWPMFHHDPQLSGWTGHVDPTPASRPEFSPPGPRLSSSSRVG